VRDRAGTTLASVGGIAANHMRRASYGPNSPVVGERGARTRQAILDTALESFQAKGLHATSVDDIAEAAGISRAALYQYFESKEQLFVELIREAAADLLDVIRRPGLLGPTAEGYDNLQRWLGEWARVQDRYKALYLQWAVVDSPQASLRPLMAEYIVAYVSALAPRLAAAVRDDDLDVDGTATVLLALLFRVNDYRQKGFSRGLGDDELLDAVATFVQLALFPSTPVDAIPASDTPARPGPPARRRSGKPKGKQAGSEQGSTTVQRILDAGAATFGARGFHATSVQDVLQAAGAGRGTFYRHFGDKTDLLVALSRDSMARLEELAGRFTDAIGDDDEAGALRRWLEECLALHRRYRGVFHALLQEGARHPALEELRGQSGAAILHAFDDALASVERAHPFDVRVGSLLLLALLERGPDYDFGTTYDLDDERIVEVLAGLVERGLLDRTPRRTATRPE
jgi:AcrR family transcriptional regulator